MEASGHWVRWHEAYEDPASPLSRRLAIVRRRLAETLTAGRPGRLQLISMCAGQGRDVFGVLAGHRRRCEVRARLVELDPVLASEAAAAARRLGLEGVDVVRADAGQSSAYVGAVPADVVLVCGVFGNVLDAEIEGTIAELPRLCAEGATVIWTRHRRPPDLTPDIRRWFVEAGFEETGFDTEADAFFSVGTARFAGTALPLRPGRRLFRFVGDGADAHH